MAIYALDNVSPILPENDDFWVADCATVIGNVELGEASSIWFGAVLRGDNDRISIGKNSNVQDLAMCHTDVGLPLTIGANVTVGHQAALHGCTIGDGTLVGMGSTILNGAKIGKNCVIGAHCLIPEGKEIPDNSMVVGMPGRVIKTLDDSHAKMLQKSADIYVANFRRFKKGLVKIS